MLKTEVRDTVRKEPGDCAGGNQQAKENNASDGNNKEQKPRDLI